MTLALLRQRLDRSLAELSLAERQSEGEARSLGVAKDREADVLSAQRIVQEVAEAVQQKAHRRIASVVTRALKAVFGEAAYSFRIDFEQKRGRTEARLILFRDGLELEDPAAEAGGGVIDVAAFALRMACVVLSLPRRRRLLVLDEPFRFVSREYRPAVRGMLESLATEAGVQIVMVTHAAELACGKVVEQ